MKFFNQNIFFIFVIIFGTLGVSAQTGEFTYQGKLNDGATAANGSYDFQFELHNSASSTTATATATRTNVSVLNGVFTVRLDFAPALFDGTPRFLKISVKSSGSPNPFIALAPYQPITSAPYAYKSLNAENATTAENANLASDSLRLGGVNADQFVQTNDARMSNARTPLPGSANYVQNTTTTQISSNFNVSGTGTANVFNAATQYNIGGNRAFVAIGGGTLSVFAGLNAGTSNTSGFGNTFVGNSSGNANTTGGNNSFFGADAGRNTNGNGNSFFGRSAGYDTTDGNDNAFFGLDAGRFNISGSNNAFFGKDSGFNNTADNNSFFGYRAGFTNTSGDANAFFGFNAGRANQTGNFNSFFGNQAGQVSTGNSNSFFGSSAGVANTSGANNSFFGAVAGFSNTSGSFNTFYGNGAGLANTIGGNNTAIGYLANFSSNNLNYATTIGSGSSVATSNTIALGRSDGSDAVLIYGNLAVNGTLNIPAGDADYIQNRTTTQTSSNFSISGIGTANIFNAATQYNIGGSRVLGINGATNIFAGIGAGINTSGTDNTFLGYIAGANNTSGTDNTFLGKNAGVNNTSGSRNIFIGANSGFLSPGAGNDNIVIGTNSSLGNVGNSIVIGNNITNSESNTMILKSVNIKIDGETDFSRYVQFDDFVRLGNLGTSGSIDVCLSFLLFATCSSSINYKSNVETYTGGLALLRRFRPVTFDWKSDSKRDIGFIAEEVAEIEPLLATRNQKGEIEGVKYKQITTVLVNSINQQQTQIEELKKQVETLKKLVCAQNPTAELCKEEE